MDMALVLLALRFRFAQLVLMAVSGHKDVCEVHIQDANSHTVS